MKDPDRRNALSLGRHGLPPGRFGNTTKCLSFVRDQKVNAPFSGQRAH
jgi:hypothetical protein